ncbi:hypothetical protein [Petrachloros mirabilis]
MPEIWLDVDAALSEVPVNIAPLVDDTDFKTRETAIAYNEAGMDLVWNFITTGGAFTQTAVTPTTAGDYDWAHQGDGMYTIEIPASGGASINNDTEGFGWFSGICTGVLPWRGPIIGFRAAGLNNALIDSAYSATRGLAGTSLPDAAADGAGGLPISDAGGLDLDTLLGRLDEAVSAAKTLTAAYDAAKTAAQASTFTGITSLAQWLGAIAGKQTPDATAQSEIRATGIGSGTFDATLQSLQGAYEYLSPMYTYTGTTIPNHLTDIKGTGFVKDTHSLPQCLTATGFATSAALATAQADLDTLTGADGVTLATAQANYAPAKAADVNAEVVDVMSIDQQVESYAAKSAAATIVQLLYAIHQMVSDFTISGTTKTTRKLDSSTTAMTHTLNDASSPTAIERTT